MDAQIMMKKVKNFLIKGKCLIFIAVGLALLALVVTAVLSRITSGGSTITTQKTTQVERGAITETVDALGVVVAMPSASLTWQSSGIVSTYTLKVGDQVEKGDILLTLDDSSISPEILQVRSSLLEAQIAFEKMIVADTDYLSALEEVTTQENILVNTYSMRHEFYSTDVSDELVEGVYANYNKARKEVWELEAAYEEVRKLDEKDPQRVSANDALQAGILKRDSLLRALSQILGTPYGYRTEGYFILYDQRVAAFAEACAAYQRLLDNSDETSAAQATMQALQNTVDQASIIAPFSGTITVISSIADEQAASGDSALRLDDLDNLLVEVAISQMDINKIVTGQSAVLTFDALPNREFQGYVTEIAEAGAETDGVVKFKVVIAIETADGEIMPGFSATASIIINQAEDALLVPNQAIQYAEDGSAFVLLNKGLGQLVQVSIETGMRSDAFSELLFGELQEGDRLVVVGADNPAFQVGSGEALREARRINGGS